MEENKIKEYEMELEMHINVLFDYIKAVYADSYENKKITANVDGWVETEMEIIRNWFKNYKKAVHEIVDNQKISINALKEVVE